MKTGIHYGVSEDRYHADPCLVPSLSSSTAHRLITQSPLHAWFHHPRLNPAFQPEDSDQLDRGKLAHAILLGGESNVVAVDPKDFPAQSTGSIPEGWTNKAIKAERDRIRGLGKIPAFKHVVDDALLMADAARRALARCERPIDLEKGKTEVTMVWQEDDVFCRSRLDWLADDRTVILDYKSTAGLAQPDHWIRNQLVSMGNDLQGAFYKRSLAVLEEEFPDYLLLVQENFKPFACSVIGLSEAQLEIAERSRELAVLMWRHCMKHDQWPGYPNRIAYATPTTWQMEEHENRAEQMIELAGQA